MMRCRVGFALVVGALCFAVVSGSAARSEAAVSAAQKAKIAECGREIVAAEKAAKAGNSKIAAPHVVKAQEALTELHASGDKDVLRTIEPLKKRVLELRTPLLLEGMELPAFDLTNAKPDASKPDATKPDPAKPTTPADGKVSFVKQVAPMLVAKCGRCHVDGSQGKFNMATFAALAKGSEAGRVIFPKDGKSSRIVEVIEQGDMPRGGAKVSAAELAALTKWIDEGGPY
jgi:mono/diheme cytochrome c family protein